MIHSLTFCALALTSLAGLQDQQGVLREGPLTPFVPTATGCDWQPFDDVKLSLIPRGLRLGQRAGRIFEFDLAGEDDGWGRVVVNDGVLVADFVSPSQGTFAVQAGPDGSHIVRQVNRRVQAACAGEVRAPRLADQVGAPPAQLSAVTSASNPVGPFPGVGAQPLEIDVLIVHTPAVRVAAGGANGVDAIAEAHAAYANSVYAASGIVQRLRLVGVEELNYSETLNTLLDLTRLKELNDGFMDSVHPLRDALRADCVVLLVEAGAAGVGYLMQDLSPDFEDRAFSVVRYDAGPIAFAHELGHNMGASHNNGGPGAAPVFCDSFGHRTPDGLWRTIMSNGPGTHVDFFSSPSLSFGGWPLGVDGTGCPSDGADSVRTLNATLSVVASFRP